LGAIYTEQPPPPPAEEATEKEVLPTTAETLWELIGPMRKDKFSKWEESYRRELIVIPLGDPRRDMLDKKWKNTFGVGWTAPNQPGYVESPAPLQPEDLPSPAAEEKKEPEAVKPKEEPAPSPAAEPAVETKKTLPPQSLTCSTRAGKTVSIKVCQVCMLKKECKDYKNWQATYSQ